MVKNPRNSLSPSSFLFLLFLNCVVSPQTVAGVGETSRHLCQGRGDTAVQNGVLVPKWGWEGPPLRDHYLGSGA